MEAVPWGGTVDDDLQRIQDRLYGALDTALEGSVAEKFPESVGKSFVVELDCYDGPDAELTEFFDRFSIGVLLIPDYQRALNGNRFLSSVSFKLNLGTSGE